MHRDPRDASDAPLSPPRQRVRARHADAEGDLAHLIGDHAVLHGTNGAVAKNVAAIAALENETLARRSALERAADAIARMAGTPWFAMAHVVWFTSWIVANTRGIPGVPAFDPYPFSFLTLVVSLEAIFLSVFVLISQNRLTRLADRRAHLDLQINLLAEQESTRTVRLLERIAAHLGVACPGAPVERELTQETKIQDVVRTLERKLPHD